METRINERRVALFVYYGWISISPSLVSTIKLLNENGYLVDIIYLYNKKFGYYKPALSNVRSIYVTSHKIRFLTPFKFIIDCYNITKSYAYDLFVGVDQEGIIAAGILSILRNIPYIYYSLEILAKEDIAKRKGGKKYLWNILKIMESYFNRKAIATIVQDEYRAKILIKDNLINERKIYLIPNSYYFEGKNIEIMRYNIEVPLDKKIIIYVGSIVQEVAIKEILSHINLWPRDTVMIIHAPNRSSYLEEVEQIIKQNNIKNKIYISIKRLTFDELCNLIRKADIGISFYKSVDKNTELACSGKVSFYLSQGIPIIINDVSPQSKELVSKYKCGICVNSSEDVGEAIRVIFKSYSKFSRNAKVAYGQELDFKKHFNNILEVIAKTAIKE